VVVVVVVVLYSSSSIVVYIEIHINATVTDRILTTK